MKARLRVARQILDFAYDLLVIGVAFWIACLLRFDFRIPVSDRNVLLTGLLIAIPVKGFVFICRGLKLGRWTRPMTFDDCLNLLEANVGASILASAAIHFATNGLFPRSVYILDFLVCIPVSGGVQFLARATAELLTGFRSHKAGRGLAIYGAGVAGLALAREVRGNPKLGYQVIGFIDDDPRKQNLKLLGLPVLGSGEQAASIVAASRSQRTPIDEIVVAMPAATGLQVRQAQRYGREAGVRCRIVPGLGELLSGKIPLHPTAPMSVTDLLGRQPVQLSQTNVRGTIAGRSVLVTGGAGSIGSELCDQLAQIGPKRLVVLDQAESELFRIEAELRSRYPALDIAAEIGDIRDFRRLEEAIEAHRIDSIFHAAAYKHVPLMERHVCEAVRNNVIGTWNVVQAAYGAKVSSLLFISSDKAVNPSSVMGLTKRVAELIVSAERAHEGRDQIPNFVCVRFGNVLVSNGSVVPTFQKQIASGGPVTVTHPDMRRFFMSVHEAVQLVLEASAMGKRSTIFVLDMGNAMRIVDLARNMIRMAGMTPDEDIEIRFTGLRPGEKLYEDVQLDDELLLPTSNEKIRVFQGRRIAFESLVPWITELQHLLWRRDPDAVLDHLRILAPEYQRSSSSDGRTHPSLDGRFSSNGAVLHRTSV